MDPNLEPQEPVEQEIVQTIEEPKMKFSLETDSEPQELFVPKSEDPVEIPEPPVETPEPPVEEPVVIPETPEVPAIETEIDEAKFIEIAKKKLGIEVNSLEDLRPKQQRTLLPEVEKFQEFIEKTGNKDYNAFLETQKDWAAETNENILKSWIKAENPSLNEKQINHLYDKKYNTEGLDESIDEDEITEKQINETVDKKKAVEFLEKRKEEFKIGGSDEYIPKEYREAKQLLDGYKQQQEQNETFFRQENEKYVNTVNQIFADDSEGLRVQLGNKEVGFEEVFIKPDNMKEARDYASDINNFNKRFYAEDGTLKDPKGFAEALMKEKNYVRDLNIAYNRGMAKKVELDDKLSKNIQPDNIREVHTPEGTPKVKFTVEK